MATAKSKSQQRRIEHSPRPMPPPPPPPAEESKALVESGLTELITKAEYDAQREQALQDPRSITEFQQEAKGMVSLDEETAAACVYALPFRNASGQTEMVRGAGARLAEILQSCYKHLRVGGFPLRETETEVIARGWCLDVQNNNLRQTDEPRSILDKHGKRYRRDGITRTMKAAIAVAKRNAILETIPQALWLPVYRQALQVIAGDSVTLASRRADAMKYLARQGVPAEAVFTTLGVRGLEDIGLDELATLRGLANAIKDGDITVEDAFFPKPAPVAGVAGAKEALQASQERAGAAIDTPPDEAPR